MKELVSKKIFDKTHIPGHHLYHSYFLTQLTKKSHIYACIPINSQESWVFFLQQQKIVITVFDKNFVKYRIINRFHEIFPLLPEFFFHFFSGALWCVTWWRRKYHLFFTVLLHLSHRTSPPIVCIFKICCKKVIYLVLNILKIKQLNLYSKKG